MPKKQRQQQKKRASIAEKERVQSRTEEKGKGETTRVVKRIHLKRLASLFSQIAPQFVYIAESASATNKQQSPLLEDSTYNIIHQIKRTSGLLYSSVKD
jgi:hypothetical protein